MIDLDLIWRISRYAPGKYKHTATDNNTDKKKYLKVFRELGDAFEKLKKEV